MTGHVLCTRSLGYPQNDDSRDRRLCHVMCLLCFRGSLTPQTTRWSGGGTRWSKGSCCAQQRKKGRDHLLGVEGDGTRFLKEKRGC